MINNKLNISLIVGLVISFIGILLTSCSMKNDNPRIISVSIQPQKYFTQTIVGDKFEVNCVIPQGSNPESYDPSPAHRSHISKSEAYLRIGSIGFELAWMDKIQQDNPKMKIYDTSKGVRMLRGTHTHNDGTVHNDDITDPHIWSSPSNARIIAKNTLNAVIELDPKNENYYRANFKKLLAEINYTDSIIRSKLTPIKGSMFIVYHPSLSYFALEYDLNQLTLEYEGKEPPPNYVQSVIDTALANNAKVFFIQREFDTRQGDVISSDIGAKVVTINPLSYNWSGGLIDIANALAEAYK